MQKKERKTKQKMTVLQGLGGWDSQENHSRRRSQVLDVEERKEDQTRDDSVAKFKWIGFAGKSFQEIQLSTKSTRKEGRPNTR